MAEIRDKMFTQLRVKNFKAWKGKHEVDLAPLSLFLGTNSAGKTSLLQMPLLLKQTAESPDRRQHLNLGGQPGDVLDLGGFKDIISGHDIKRELAFGLHWRPHEGQNLVEFDYEVSFCQATRKVGFGAFESRSQGPVVNCLTYASEGRTFKAARQKEGSYLLTATEAKDSGQIEGAEPLPPKRSYEPERAVAFSAEGVAALGPEGGTLQDIALQMVQALKEIVYLGPLRERPQRIYQWSDKNIGNLGTKGEVAIQALLASANDRTKRTATGGRGWLVEQVSRWLKILGVANKLSLEQQGSSVHYEVVIHRGKIDSNLVDVGFGVSQVLPVVTLAYFVPEGSTVIVEEPEIHLHPLAQSALADLFVEVSKKRKVQFLVETHSENLFRRLQSRIADETLAPEDCSLYFVKRGEDGAELQRLEVDLLGNILNWPKDFFGDEVGEMAAMARAQMERKIRTGA